MTEMIVFIHPGSMREEKWFPRSIRIPSEKHSSFNEWAQRNHSQTVEQLNRRGGLDPSEIWAIYQEKRWERLSRQDLMRALQLCVDLAADRD